MSITPYPTELAAMANDIDLAAERKMESIPGGQAIRVSADWMGALRKAYPILSGYDCIP